MQSLKEMLKLALALCRQDIQERFAGSLLGALWVFIWPLVQLFIYIVIFGKMMGGRLGGESQIYSYGVYVASGLIAWTCFANTLQRSARVFLEKRHIIAKVNVSLPIFPLFICLSELLPFTLSFLLLFAADLFFGWRPDPLLFVAMLFGLYCQQVLAVGVGLLCATFAVFIKDVIETLSVIVQIGFWFTPIVYLPSILPHWVQTAIVGNPMFPIVSLFQNFFVFGHAPEWTGLLYAFLLSHVFFGIAFWFMKKLEKDIRDML